MGHSGRCWLLVSQWVELMTDLERSDAELRTALILAGQEIRELNFGRADSAVRAVLRRVLRKARAVACKEGLTMRVRLDVNRPPL
jgi:hypothetical protein